MARSSQKNPNDLPDLPAGWSTRDELIRLIVDDPLSGDCNGAISVTAGPEDLIPIWLRYLFVHNTWQLTTNGYTFFSLHYIKYSLKHHRNAETTGRLLTNLGRTLGGPWKIHGQSLYVWDQSKYFELRMFDGDAHQFVDFHAPK